MNPEKIEETIEKLQWSRDALFNDLNVCGNQLSVLAHVAIQNTVSEIDGYIRELQSQLDEMKWYDFVESAWGDESKDTNR